MRFIHLWWQWNKIPDCGLQHVQDEIINKEDGVADVDALESLNNIPPPPLSMVPYHEVFTWAGQAIRRASVVQYTIDTGEATQQR